MFGNKGQGGRLFFSEDGLFMRTLSGDDWLLVAGAGLRGSK